MTPFQFATIYKGRRVRIAEKPAFHPEVRGQECVIDGNLYYKDNGDALIVCVSIHDINKQFIIDMIDLTLLQQNNPLPLPG